MSENWVVVLIHPKDPVRILLDFIVPTVKELESQNLLETFHFFFEPEIHFRVLPKNEGQHSQIESIIKGNLAKAQQFIEKFSFSSYTGEEGAFGVEGWQIVQRYFEYCCRASLLNLEVHSKRKTPPYPQYVGEQFNLGKLVHCFLNQMGFDASRESQFHNDRTIERLLIINSNIFERLDKLESRLKGLEETIKSN